MKKNCPKSIMGIHYLNKNGVCSWCNQKVESKVKAPRAYDTSDLTQAYGYYLDPDFGNDRNDVY